MMRDPYNDAMAEVQSRAMTVTEALHMAVTNHAINMPDYLKAAYNGWLTAELRLERARQAEMREAA